MNFGCVQRGGQLARDVTSAPSWMSAGEMHVEWRDGEDFFYKYYYYITKAQIV